MTNEEMQAELAKLKAENETLKNNANKPLTFRVSDKKALSVYGMGRFPVTLYRQQWERLLERADDIRAFIGINAAVLAVKE